MTLGDVIKRYRKEHGYSMDKFSALSGISKAYISMLEKDYNPKTGLPIAPSIDVFKKVASVVGIDVNKLLRMVDTQLITLDITTADDARLAEIKAIYNSLPAAGQEAMWRMAKGLANK